MSYTTIAVIYNPNSTGSSEALAREFKSQIKARLPKQKVELLKTEYTGHGEELCYQIASSSKKPLIISSSGDGGYHDVINGAMRAKLKGFNPTTGLLPAGNANDHYNSMHSESLVEQIAKGASRKIDILKISSISKGKRIERYAHSYIGFGLTPFVGKELNRNKLNPVNQFLIVARSLFAIKPIQLKIGRRPLYYESVIFSNVDVMSKYLKISQPSSMTDGKFEVTIFKRRNKVQLILVLLKASFIGVKEDRRVKRFSFKTMNTTLVQADGEILTLDAHVKTRITIKRQILTCIV